MIRASWRTIFRTSETIAAALGRSSSRTGRCSKKRHSRPLRVMLRTTLREKIELGMLKISRSKERIVVRYLG